MNGKRGTGTPIGRGPRLSEQDLKKLLDEGRKIDDVEYFEHCKINIVKTFYYFCKKLSDDRVEVALSSTKLRQYIVSELGPSLMQQKKRFNPEGWFGETWTDQQDEKCFRSEFSEVLIRSDDEPYHYSIRPEYRSVIRSIFVEFQRGV
jgi:hypothetical protein